MSKKIIIFVISSLIAISVYIPVPSLATDEASTTTAGPSLSTGVINPYTPTQTWIDAYDDADKIHAIVDIQPGSAIYMRELASRFTTLYYAVRAKNWDLAEYMLEYARKIMQFNRVTRPKRKDAFTSFLTNAIGDTTNPVSSSLQAAVNAKDAVAFKKAFKSAVETCNACHVSTNHAYVIYKLPRSGPDDPLSFTPLQ